MVVEGAANRTCQTPTTPSDVGHLLPPIGDRKARRHNSDNLPPVPPLIEPPLPRPAPVDCNLVGLYDPALDPSPIGKEERGKVQPVRISRIVPRCASSSGPQDSKGVNPNVATVVTVLNGYRTKSYIDRLTSKDGNWGFAADSDDEDCIDIFVEGFSRGIDHATLLPSEVFCRVLQNGSKGISDIPRNPSGEAGPSLDVSERYLGLTILLARTGEWFQTAAQGPQNDQGGGEADDNAADRNIDGHSSEAIITQLIFQRADGTPGPSRNASRVQFEPGPLGVELEAYPGRSGIVQVRRVLQAGQAELDGRLCAGSLIVAVGDWDESGVFDPPPPARDGDPAATRTVAAEGVDIYGSLDVINDTLRALDESAGVGKGSQGIIRSLGEIEQAISRRGSDRLFFLWVLDRQAPEAIAALGYPEADGARTAPCKWSPQSTVASCQSEGNGEAEGPYPPSKIREGLSTSFGISALLRPKSRHLEAENKPLGGAPGWESGSAFFGGKDSLEYSLSSNDVLATASNRSRTRPDDQLGERGVQPVSGPSQSALEYPKGVTRDGVFKSRKEIDINWTSRKEETTCSGYRFEKGGGASTVGWEFETGGGIFDEDDQGLAARKHPREMPPARKADKELPQPFPLGLQASVVDEFAVFIWFCNNHESAVMKVSWVDYDGRRVSRRSLAPGSCYFERSFATHPWVIQHDDSNDRGDTESLHREEFQHQGEPGERSEPHHQRRQQYQTPQKRADEHDEECCVVRLGDAMSRGRLTGSLVWNPTGRTLSMTKQAKVGVPGMSAAGHAAVGSDADDGAGLDPGMKRLCMAGPRREAEEARARAVRSIVREEKIRTLQEMKTWRTHPPGEIGVGVGSTGDRRGDSGCGSAESVGRGLGQGVPNLRVVMVGSSSSGYNE